MPDLIVINLVESFFQGVRAQIQLNGTLTEGINVRNGLRCTWLLYATSAIQPVHLSGNEEMAE